MKCHRKQDLTSCKLSPLETVCIKCQILFSGKNKKNISLCCLLKILRRLLSVKVIRILRYLPKILRQTIAINVHPGWMPQNVVSDLART